MRERGGRGEGGGLSIQIRLLLINFPFSYRRKKKKILQIFSLWVRTWFMESWGYKYYITCYISLTILSFIHDRSFVQILTFIDFLIFIETYYSWLCKPSVVLSSFNWNCTFHFFYSAWFMWQCEEIRKKSRGSSRNF